ncbi:lymphocyte antigen 6E-like isoform X2 [Eublepharis macularius]|uniref:Lymphocyte antigen 6E-like isoform X2 n=1 Tax=Eublepharis macularius TaxID=481883 RepID=A0AA97JR69_EUBMA|nr:lymphocyte antigen 6E-like isoform X2 [Eublepharis macularius]
MKTCTVFLVVAALCVQRASSLWCYKCENAQYHKDCKEVKCSDMDSFCVTAKNEVPDQELLVSKWCSANCPRAGEIKGGKRSVDCCQTDYCNSGSGSVRGSYAVMGTALLASSFYILRTWL